MMRFHLKVVVLHNEWATFSVHFAGNNSALLLKLHFEIRNSNAVLLWCGTITFT